MPVLSSFFRLAEVPPPPLPNPEGEEHPTHWFHGTRYEFYDHDDHDGDPEVHQDPGGKLQAPDRQDYDYGQNASEHWNTGLGVHFTSLHHVAQDQFAGGAGGSGNPDARVAHCNLHIGNPKHYDSEFDMSREAVKWAHDRGHHYLGRRARKGKNADQYEDHLDNGGHYADIPHHDHLEYVDANTDHDQRRAIDRIDRGDEDQKHHDYDRYLALHPERDRIVGGFKQHLQDQGHDGITYGNEYEGPKGHKCAIAFDEDQIHMKRWQWLHRDKQHLNKEKHFEPKDPDQPHLVDRTYTPEHGYHWADPEGKKLGSTPIWRGPQPKWDNEEYERRSAIHPKGGEGYLDEHVGQKRHWQGEVRKALSRGDLHPQEAWNNGYKGLGHDENHRGDAYHHDTDRHNLSWEHMPETLYHVTTNKAAVLAEGHLKSRDELSQKGGHGLGGGESDTISFTDDPEVARHIHRALHEYHSVLTGKKTVQHMLDEAHQGGYLHHVVGSLYGGGKDWKHGDPLPMGLSEGLKGRHVLHDTMFKTHAEVQEKHPDAQPVEGSDYHDAPKGRIHYHYSEPMSDDDKMEWASSHYKYHAAMREHYGPNKELDPGFIFNDVKGMASTHPSQFGIVRVHPKPGSRGYKVSALGEWRTADGTAAPIAGLESPHGPEGDLAKQSARQTYPCPECGHDEATPIRGQMRKGVEVPTGLVSCNRCEHPYNPYIDHQTQRELAEMADAERKRTHEVFKKVLPDTQFYEHRPNIDEALRKTRESEDARMLPIGLPAVGDLEKPWLKRRREKAVADSEEFKPEPPGLHSQNARTGKQDSQRTVLANPYREDTNEWFHGTIGEHEHLDPQGVVDGHRPPGNGAGGPQMNKLLGVHFSPLHEVAHHFAGPHHGAAHGRIFHAELHMKNPIHFTNENALLRHVWDTTMRSSYFHNDKHDGNMQWSHSASRESINRRLDESKHLPEGALSSQSGLGSAESYLQFHPQQKDIAAAYVNHLRYEGHDGITYGNDVEGPRRHHCAIAFDPKTIHVTSVDKMHPAGPGHPAWPQETKDKAKPREGEVSHHSIRTKHGESEEFLNEVERYHNGGKTRDEGAPYFGPNTGRGDFRFHGVQTPPEGTSFHAITFDDGHGAAWSRHPEHGLLGEMVWDDTKTIGNIGVAPKWYRNGIASGMLAKAREIEPDLKHNAERTLAGDAWAKSTGDDIPERIKPTGAKHEALLPGYEHEHEWLPEGKVFAPSRGGLDPILFDEHRQMYPGVHQVIFDRLNGVLEPMGLFDWQRWSRVYLAGSEASEWWGNRDFDTLIGVEYSEFRKAHPEHGDSSDDEISDLMNGAFRKSYNDEDWVAPWDGEVWHLTAFVNPDSWDIRRIKPYAAYNMSVDQWAVEPVVVGKDWGPEKWPEGTWDMLESYLALIKAIEKMPHPEQERQGANLYDWLHGDRRRAFCDHGTGWSDPGNVIWKALDLHPSEPLSKLVAWKHEEAKDKGETEVSRPWYEGVSA